MKKLFGVDDRGCCLRDIERSIREVGCEA